jgi:dolichol-phosphate mannosyltransferase
MPSEADRLFVVLPVYNEAAGLARLFDEWLPALQATGSEFTVCALNDGSTDASAAVLRALAQACPNLLLVDKPNAGHGATCVQGYRTAIDRGADWVLQIDSDGQCDPAYFAAFWAGRSAAHPLYGHRRQRDDGAARQWVSRVVSLVVFAASGTWVRDANVPYRLMHRSQLEAIVPRIPADFHLANVLLAIRQQQRYGIRWIDIRFRRRLTGTPSVRLSGFLRRGVQLFVQIRRARSAG